MADKSRKLLQKDCERLQNMLNKQEKQVVHVEAPRQQLNEIDEAVRELYKDIYRV